MSDNINQYPELVKTLKLIGKNSAMIYKSNLKSKMKIASGKLYNSIDYRVELTENGCKLYFVAEKYYINIENGRKPNSKMPPVDVIKRWMQIKNITPRNGQSINTASYLISRSIGKKGIKANPFLREIKKNLKDWVDDIKMSVEIDLNIQVKAIVTKIKNIPGNKYIQIKK